MHIDTGASVNVIDSCTYDRMKEQTSSSFRLAPTRSRLFPYGAAAPLPVLGEFIATISCSNTQWTTARFVVVRGKSGCLLSRDTATILRLVHITGDDKITSTMPRAPWSRLHVDLCGPLPTGETLLVVIAAPQHDGRKLKYCAPRQRMSSSRDSTVYSRNTAIPTKSSPIMDRNSSLRSSQTT